MWSAFTIAERYGAKVMRRVNGEQWADFTAKVKSCVVNFFELLGVIDIRRQR